MLQRDSGICDIDSYEMSIITAIYFAELRGNSHCIEFLTTLLSKLQISL
jgi:hypothetical protein